MFYNNTYCKTVESDKRPDKCDLYWDDYRLGTVCYNYNENSDRIEIVYHKKEIAHIPEVLVRKFFGIPSMSDLKRCYEQNDVHDTHGLLNRSRD